MMNKTEYEFGEAIIKDSLIDSSNIYVDLSYLKYLGLGRLIAHQNMEQAIYTQLLQIVSNDSFKARCTDDVEVIFQSVPELKKLLSIPNSRSDDVTLRVSPEFDGALQTILEFVGECRSSKSILGENSPITITINTSSLPDLSYAGKKYLLNFYTEKFGTDIIIDPIGLVADKTENSLAFDTYFISHLDKFNAALLPFLDERKFMNKQVICSKTLPLAQLPHVEKDTTLTETLFKQIEVVMMMAAKFSFSSPFRCLTDKP